MPSEEDGMDRDGSPSPQLFCLKWNNIHPTLMSSFEQLRQNKIFVDVTLACDGQDLKAHKLVLSACSPYFESLLVNNPCTHPIIILKDIKFNDLLAVVDFMYRGEINVPKDQLSPLFKVAETLKVRGLTEVSADYSVQSASSGSEGRAPKRHLCPDGEKSPPRRRRRLSPEQSPGRSPRQSPSRPASAAGTESLGPPESAAHPGMPLLHADDVDIRPGIAEMIREEERAKQMEHRVWPGPSSSVAGSYQYQVQSMFQQAFTTNQALHNLRFRERGPLKSWRAETMAEAIFSVLKEGLSLSQAARKYDIPYPTFVLYANRVHNMLGPSADGGADLRPKGRGRPQRILLGVWPDQHIRDVIRTVVFRHDNHAAAPLSNRLAITDGLANACGNGREDASSPPVAPHAAAAAAVAAVAHGLRRQMLIAAAQRPPDHLHLGLPAPLPMQSPSLFSSEGLESPLCSPPPPGYALEPPPKNTERYRPFATPTPNDVADMGPPKMPVSHGTKNGKDGVNTPVSMSMDTAQNDTSPVDNVF